MSSYQPVTEFTPENQDTRLVWRFNLPPSLDAERIEINMPRLERLHRIGGIAASIVYDYQGERTEFTPGISGVNPDGSAVATKAGTIKKAEDSSSQKFDLFPPFIDAQYGKILAVHGINKAELAGSVADAVRRGGSSREAVWAKLLDKSMRTSVRRNASSHLLDSAPKWITAIDSFWLGSGVMTYAGDIIEAQPSLSSAMYPAVWSFNVGIQLLRNKQITGETLVKDRRWSLATNQFQPDRYLALSALTRMPGLIRAKR